LWIAFFEMAEQSGGAVGYQPSSTRRFANTWTEKL